MIDAINIKVEQILNFFEFKELHKTQFCEVYSLNGQEIALFLDQDNSNCLTAMDVKSRRKISQQELIYDSVQELKLNENLLSGIRNAKPIPISLTEQVVIEQVIKYLYGFLPLKMTNPLVQKLDSFQFLLSGELEVYENNDGDLIIPLFQEGVLCNYYIVNDKANILKYKDAKGFFHSKFLPENEKVLISFDFRKVLSFFQENLSIKYHTILPNLYSGVGEGSLIYSYINGLSSCFNEINFLYDFQDKSELFSVFSFVHSWINLQQDLLFTFEFKEPGCVINIYPPKQFKAIKINQFFADLQSKLYENLGISDNSEDKEFIKPFSFCLENNNINNLKFFSLSFPLKFELIEIYFQLLMKLSGNGIPFNFINIK